MTRSSQPGVVERYFFNKTKLVNSFRFNESIRQVVWLHKNPNYFIVIFESGKVKLQKLKYSEEFLRALNENSELPAKWMITHGGAAFSWADELVVFSPKLATISKISLIRKGTLKNVAENLLSDLESNDKIEVLSRKIEESETEEEKLVWLAMKTQLNGNNFDELFREFGYDKTDILKNCSKITKNYDKIPKGGSRPVVNPISVDASAEDAFSVFKKIQGGTSKVKKIEEKPEEKHPMTLQETVSINTNWNASHEKNIKEALLIGDVESAAEIALKAGRHSEALIIASSGNKELFDRIKNEYLKTTKDLYVKNILSNVINRKFEELLKFNVTSYWKDYIIYSKTYLSDDEFREFANLLSNQLRNSGLVKQAIVCSILAYNFEATTQLIFTTYKEQAENLSCEEAEILLHVTFEKIMLLKHSLMIQTNDEVCNQLYTEYCKILVNLNMHLEAYRLLLQTNTDAATQALMSRIYVLKREHLKKYKEPASPFEVTYVVKRTGTASKTKKSTAPKTKDLFENVATEQPKKKNPFEAKGTNPFPNPKPIVTESKNPVPVKKSNPFPTSENQNEAEVESINSEPVQTSHKPNAADLMRKKPKIPSIEPRVTQAKTPVTKEISLQKETITEEPKRKEPFVAKKAEVQEEVVQEKPALLEDEQIVVDLAQKLFSEYQSVVVTF